MTPRIDKPEFKDGYIKRSGLTEEFFDQNFVILECGCDYDGCLGYAVISNIPAMIENHKRLYGPK